MIGRNSVSASGLPPLPSLFSAQMVDALSGSFMSDPHTALADMGTTRLKINGPGLRTRDLERNMMSAVRGRLISNLYVGSLVPRLPPVHLIYSMSTTVHLVCPCVPRARCCVISSAAQRNQQGPQQLVAASIFRAIYLAKCASAETHCS